LLENKISKNLVFLILIYCSILVLSNLTASKITTIAGFHFTAAIVFFPITYIIGDIITEVYGFDVSRKIIWLGLFANLVIQVGAYIIIYLPPAKFWQGQQAFFTVFGISFRIFFASMSAYIFGELLNSFILAKLKVSTSGKYFFIRAILSTVIAALFDTTIFMIISFYGNLPLNIIIEMIGIEYIIKLGVEVIFLPITIFLVRYLKNKEKVDHFDYNLKFKIF